jgi:hypothetical protein
MEGEGEEGGGACLCCEVLEDGSEVDGGAGADAFGVAAVLEVAADPADGELEPCLDGAGHRLLPRPAELLGAELLPLAGVHLLASCLTPAREDLRFGMGWQRR